MEVQDKIGIYVFSANSKVAPQERIRQSAVHYAAYAEILLTQELEILAGEYGKPYFKHYDRLHFSVSHSGEYYLCGLHTSPLGIDIEKIHACNRLGIARRFFHAEEYEFLLQKDEEAFFRVWTAKESYVKYLGRGISDEFSQFSVAGAQQTGLLADGSRIAYLDGFDGYCACVCSAQIAGINIFREGSF
ncbi:4'-phosphopantetheinyl transferase superfamily protein [Clostridia bacterium OttesenSCG-928-F22]|nr:4'-phosphopantetheinyl transferase superfamily protein [Clostridia bacterium OttesenSCG-928-F22]